MPCRIPEALAFLVGLPTRLFDEVIPSINDGLGPEGRQMWPTRCQEKKASLFIAETEHQKKNGKKKWENLQVWIFVPEVDSSHAIHLSAHTWSTILCPHRWRTCYGCYVSDFKDSKIASFRNHISHLLLEPRRKSSHGGLPQFQETGFHECCTSLFVGRCHNSVHIPD